ncbi:hypothetical protein ACHAWF_008859 [Thalassiosira exigua]
MAITFDGRGVCHHFEPCRWGKISVVVALAITIFSPTATMAQTPAPTDDVASVISSPTAAPVISPPAEQTLAPFTPISTDPPVTAPTDPPPTTAAPTAPLLPTASPTMPPSFVPSLSAAPSDPPSVEPTHYPTSSQQPSIVPSTSAAPSSVPSTSPPTGSPTPEPSYSPVVAPSGMPSTNVTLLVKRECSQVLVVEQAEKFSEVQMGIYQLLMQSYTINFGYNVAEPLIVTTCEVTEQDLAVGSGGVGKRLRDFFHLRRRRRGRRLQTENNLLILEFTMQYESRFGYDVENYPRQFQSYVNSNLEQVAADMDSRFLPVISAKEVIVYNTKEPTMSPTTGLNVPSISPSSVLDRPTGGPTASPTSSGRPSEVPSRLVLETASPTLDNDQTSFVVGLAAGLGGAAVVVALLIWHLKRRNRRKDDGGRQSYEGHQNSSPQDQGMAGEVGEEGVIQRVIEHYSGHDHGGSSDREIDDGYPPGEERPESGSPGGGTGTVADSIFSNPSMVSGGESLGSDPADDYEMVQPLEDEFDNYKNQDLERLRTAVEESVYGAEGMMSLAMTRALMEEEEDDINLSWGGAEDPESIEANGLCETNDWLRKNEHSTLEERNKFFQEILNRMVITVRRGKISPSDGTRAIHCCAAMLGLQLEKDLPNNVLLVHGMRKTNDLSLGRSYLVEAFISFGDIEGAAIAPSNKGFGFVRFVSPKSVQRALERFRISEIEVQDVSVMIKSLKADGPAV